MPKIRSLALTALLALVVPLVAGAQEKTQPRLELSPCTIPRLEGPARCGAYSVFENRETRSGRKIDLNVVVLPATGPDKAPDPLFMIAGGPGQGSASLAAQLAPGLTPHQSRRDIVLVDQRGTGRSNPLRCDPPEGANLTRWHTGLQFDKEHFRQCRERLSKQADLTQYTTVQAVEDLDEVRAALGYDKINLMGGSYGSRVVLVYLRQFPQRVRSAMAWSVAPTDMKNPLPFSQNAQRSLEAILSDCEADAVCKAAFPKVREQFHQALARLEAGPIQVTVTDLSGEKVSVTVDRGWMGEAVRYAMYSEERARYLPMMIDQAFRGDYAPLVEEGLINRIALGRGLAMGMLMSVICTEDIPLIRPEEVKTAAAGTFLGDYRVKQQTEACQGWPRGKLPAGYSEDVRSDVPVLLISGELDPATSPVQAESALASLSRSRHVVVPDAGHGWWELEGAECVAGIIKDFLASADPARLNTSCLAKVRRKPFVTPPVAPESQRP